MTIVNDIDALAAEKAFSGVVRIDRGDEVVLEKAYGFAHRGYEIPNETDTRFAIASGVKGLTALAVVGLVEDGTLELTTTARSLLGDDLPLIADDVTVEHLLAHRSGIGDYFDEDVETEITDYLLRYPSTDSSTRRTTSRCSAGIRRSSRPTSASRTATAASSSSRSSRSERAACRSTSSSRSASASRPGCPRRRSCARTSCRAAPRSATSPRTVFARTCSTCRCAVPATAASTRRLPTCVRSGKRSSRGGSSREWVAEMTRPRSDSPEDDRRYGLGFWLHGTTDAVMLEGYDAGVSFRSLHDPVARVTATVISNWSNGAWPLVPLLEEALAA